MGRNQLRPEQKSERMGLFRHSWRLAVSDETKPLERKAEARVRARSKNRKPALIGPRTQGRDEIVVDNACTRRIVGEDKAKRRCPAKCMIKLLAMETTSGGSFGQGFQLSTQGAHALVCATWLHKPDDHFAIYHAHSE